MDVLKNQQEQQQQQKLLEIISDFSKAVGYKVNAQKLITFLYTSNEQAATRILKDITIYISIQKARLHIEHAKDSLLSYKGYYKIKIFQYLPLNMMLEFLITLYL